MITTTYTPVKRRFPPRHGIVARDGVGRRTFWYRTRAARDAEMTRITRAAKRQTER